MITIDSLRELKNRQPFLDEIQKGDCKENKVPFLCINNKIQTNKFQSTVGMQYNFPCFTDKFMS